MNAASEAAMQDAFRAIEAMCARQQARQDRIATDARMIRLEAWFAAHRTDITAKGMAGGQQMFADLFSPDHAETVRAKKLITARIGQLDGNRAAARVGLTEAAKWRREAYRRRTPTLPAIQHKAA